MLCISYCRLTRCFVTKFTLIYSNVTFFAINYPISHELLHIPSVQLF